MSSLVIAYLDDTDVTLSLLLVNKALKPYLTGYRLKAGVIPDVALELNNHHFRPRYVDVIPTRLTGVTDLLSLSSFESVTSIHVDFSCGIIVPGTFHESVTELTIGCRFREPITRNMFPHQLKKLTLGPHFNHNIAPDVLPDSLKYLQLGPHFDHSLTAGSLPAALASLDLGIHFNHPLSPGTLPSTLTKLKLSDYFNQPLRSNTFPDSLLSLSLGVNFNQDLVPGVVPPSVTELELGMRFNKPLEPGCFPDALHKLTLGMSFNQPIVPGVLPPGLKYLCLGMAFGHSFDDIPSSVTTWQAECAPLLPFIALPSELLELDCCFFQGLVLADTLPSSVTKLGIQSWSCQPASIPSSITRLTMYGSVAAGIIPNSVTHLV